MANTSITFALLLTIILSASAIDSDGYTYIRHLNAKYKLNTPHIWFYRALLDCERDEAKMFAPKDMKEAEMVFRQVVPNDIPAIFIGIHKLNGSDSFTVLDYLEINEKKFFTNAGLITNDQSEELVAQLNSNMTFRVADLYDDLHYICVIPVERRSTDVNKFYKLFNEKVDWSEAADNCYKKNSILAMPNDEMETISLSNDIKNKYTDIKESWVGFQNVVNDLKIVDMADEYILYGKYNWKAGNTKTGCVSLLSDGSLVVQNCTLRMPYFCEYDLSYVNWTRIRKSYAFSGLAMTWFKAREYCKNDGATLAMPTSLDQMKVLQEMMKSVEEWPIFVGYHSLVAAEKNTLLKSSKSVPEYLKRDNLNISKGSGLCGAFGKDGLYKDDCNKEQYFFCEKDL